MALPMSNTPVYTLKIPSTGKQVKFRPFLVKDEKALLIAQQSEKLEVMIDTLKGVIKSCIMDEEINVDEFATFDLEYVFTQIRAKSVGEKIELLFKCDTCEDEKAVTKVSIDLTSLEVVKTPDHTNKIPLFDKVGMTMKYPTAALIDQLSEAGLDTDINKMFDIVAQCIDTIYDDDEVFYGKDHTRAELLDFLNNLTSDQFAKIQNFFSTMPKLSKPVSYSCPVCGKKHDKVLEGLASFF